jgi:hypothetical protein
MEEFQTLDITNIVFTSLEKSIIITGATSDGQCGEGGKYANGNVNAYSNIVFSIV